MFLLGAGASVPAGVPDSYNMTEKLLRNYNNDYGMEKHSRILPFVIGGLLFQKGKEGLNPFDGVNVEEVFNAILLLADRNSLEVAPFIGSWNEMIDTLDKITNDRHDINSLNEEIYKNIIATISKSSLPSLSVRKIEDALQKTVASVNRGKTTNTTLLSSAIKDYVENYMKKWLNELKSEKPNTNYSFQKKFTSAIKSMDDIPGKGEIFNQTAEWMIRKLINLVWIKDVSKVLYLKPLLNVLKQQDNKCCIASLNYDNAIELLAKSEQIPFSTAIKEWPNTGSFCYEGNGILLLKLHGSIDWKLIRNQCTPDKPLPQSMISEVIPDNNPESSYRPAIIFGQKNKLTTEGPFLDLIRAFQIELSKCTKLTVIGYSFRDEHINEYITQWLNRSENSEIAIIDPNIDRIHNEYVNTLHKLPKNRIKIYKESVENVLTKLYVNCEY